MADVVVNNDNVNPRELLGQGVRAYVLQDYSSAVTALSKACELLVTEHGDDQHDSLGDPYLYYGKSLLGLSRQESEALGDAVREKSESDDEEEEADNTETEEGDAKEETEASGTAATENETSDDKSESVNCKEVESNGTAKEGEPSGSTTAENTDEKVENEEDTTDLQVAWEVLELAKKIYQKRGEEGEKNLAETLVILGEVSLENENFEAAINDIKEGLTMQKKLFPDDSRTVAETYYKLGVAYSTNTQIDEAVGCFRDALKYLQGRINNLEKTKDKDDEAKEEIEEIKGLVPDIEEKITDMLSYKDETMKQIMSAISDSKPTCAGEAASSSSIANSSKPVSNISHLVKRKRKLDEIVEDVEKEAEASPAKKPPS